MIRPSPSSFQSPPENSALLCPIEEVHLNYTIVELEVEVDSANLTFAPGTSDYIITPLMPGTSYTVTVWFVNEVGESLDNPTGMCIMYNSASHNITVISVC